MDSKIIASFKAALATYEQDINRVTNSEDKADLLRVASVAQSLIEALEKNDLRAARLKALGFSRQASDVYCAQPPSFKAVASDVAKVKKMIT